MKQNATLVWFPLKHDGVLGAGRTLSLSVLCEVPEEHHFNTS